jgi:hypothetical protein
MSPSSALGASSNVAALHVHAFGPAAFEGTALPWSDSTTALAPSSTVTLETACAPLLCRRRMAHVKGGAVQYLKSCTLSTTVVCEAEDFDDTDQVPSHCADSGVQARH